MERVHECHRYVMERDETTARLRLKLGEGPIGYLALHIALIVLVVATGVVPLFVDVGAARFGALIIAGILLSFLALFHTIDSRARAPTAHRWLRRGVTRHRRGSPGYRETDRGFEVDGEPVAAEGARVLVTSTNVPGWVYRRIGPSRRVNRTFYDVHLVFEGLVVQLLRTRREDEAKEIAERVAELFEWPAPGETRRHGMFSSRTEPGATALSVILGWLTAFGLTMSLLTSSSTAWLVAVLGFVLVHLLVQQLVLRLVRGRAQQWGEDMLAFASRLPDPPSETGREKKGGKRKSRRRRR